MSDIVERAREYARNLGGDPQDYLVWQLADEIERLAAENDMLRSMLIDAPTKAERDELFERRAAALPIEEHEAMKVHPVTGGVYRDDDKIAPLEGRTRRSPKPTP